MKIIDETSKSSGPYFSVKDAEYLDGYRLRVLFNDGAAKIVDFGPFLQDAWQSWITKYRDIREFRNYKIVSGNVNWNDYELIFPISDLRRGAIEYQPSKFVSNGKNSGKPILPTKNLELVLPAPMHRRLKAIAKREDVPIELLIQKYIEESMARRGKRV